MVNGSSEMTEIAKDVSEIIDNGNRYRKTRENRGGIQSSEILPLAIWQKKWKDILFNYIYIQKPLLWAVFGMVRSHPFPGL